VAGSGQQPIVGYFSGRYGFELLLNVGEQFETIPEKAGFTLGTGLDWHYIEMMQNGHTTCFP
jgi:hypothetical protein